MKRKGLLVVVVVVVACCFVNNTSADQPRLGFSGDLVGLAGQYEIHLPNGMKGVKIRSVNRVGPARRMGLERGDIILTIDNVAFSSWEGYFAALRMASQRPNVVLINVRNGRPTRRNCSLPHVRDTRYSFEEGRLPPGTIGLSINFRE